MSVVYVVGAGASFGDTLEPLSGTTDIGALVNPPLANGFFSESLFARLGYSAKAFGMELDKAIFYIGLHWGLKEDFGTGRWSSLSLEQVLSHVELELDFIANQSENWIQRLQVRNQILRHLFRTISLCTLGGFGNESRRLVSALRRSDTLISFNWDLLLDQEFEVGLADAFNENDFGHYQRFLGCLEPHPPGNPQVDSPLLEGLFLKPHGSLNWYRCTNDACPSARSFVRFPDVQDCLKSADIPQWKFCANCGEKSLPFIVPPVPRKPITSNSVIRHTWGLARGKLQRCEKLVVIGFSVTSSDFYAEWLLRSTTTHLGQADIFIVNPSNDSNCSSHAAFHERMSSIFPRGYNSEFKTIAELPELLNRMKASPHRT